MITGPDLDRILNLRSTLHRASNSLRLATDRSAVAVAVAGQSIEVTNGLFEAVRTSLLDQVNQARAELQKFGVDLGVYPPM